MIIFLKNKHTLVVDEFKSVVDPDCVVDGDPAILARWNLVPAPVKLSTSL